MAIGQKKSWADVEEEEEGSSSTTTTTTTSQPTTTTTTSAPPSTSTVAAASANAAAYEEFVAPSDVDLESLQLDASNPLFSENKKFEQFGLRDELLQGVYALRYNMPSKIQSRALPILIHEPGMNLIAQSQSGTGKTATFGLGVLQHIDETKAAVQAIIAAPSLELADQIFNVLTKLAKFTKIGVRSVLKGDMIKNKVMDHVVVGTPGKLSDLIKKRFIDTKSVCMFVIDEADQMLEKNANDTMNNKNSMLSQCQNIQKVLPSNSRVILFSATYAEDEMLTGEDARVQKEREAQVIEFAQRIVPQPLKTILVPREELTLSNMKQYYVVCQNDDEKERVLQDMFSELQVGQSIIFVNRKQAADVLYERLRRDGFKVAMLHSGLMPEDRKRTITEFKVGNSKVLISTNVLSRGLDISTVTHVVNFDLPTVYVKPTRGGGGAGPMAAQADFASYLHRIGRTARFGRSGTAINLCASQEDLDVIKQLNSYFKITIKEVNKDDIADGIK